MSETEDDKEIDFYHALATLIEEAYRDRRAMLRATRRLNEAASRFNQDFPDYAVLATLVEQAERDQTAIRVAHRAMGEAVNTLESQAAILSHTVSNAVVGQIAASLSKAAESITRDVNNRFSEIDIASERASRRLEAAAHFATWKVSWLPCLCLAVGLLVGVLFERWLVS